MSEIEENEANEWDNVACLPIVDISQNYDEESLYAQELNFVSCQQLTDFFENVEIGQQLPNIKSETKISILKRLFRFVSFRNPPNLNDNLINQRNRIFAIAIQPFDNRNKFHSQCQYTVYSKLTGNLINGHRKFGHHWEEIGFQSTDPSTDFRGVGLLGLLQLTFLVTATECKKLCKEIYSLSLDPKQHYPFAVMSLNVTQISLQVLREGLLNRYINQSNSALKVFNQFYYGTFLRFYNVWKEENKTIVDTGYVLRDLRKIVRKNIQQNLDSIAKYNRSEKNNQCKFEDDFTNIGII